MSIRTELLALKNADGLIVPEEVLAWARRHTRSHLHKAINWDDAYNINAYLLVQVRNLVTLHVRIDRKKPDVISLSIDRAERDGGGYRDIQDVLAVPRLRRVMLDDALRELELLQKRFEELDELEPVWQAAQAIRTPPPPVPAPAPARRGRGRRGEARPAA